MSKNKENQVSDSSGKRPIFIWVAGIAGMACAAIGAVALPLSVFLDRELALIPLMISISFVGLLGIGLFTGRSAALIFAKFLWVLWAILVGFSCFAASSYAGGPNWGHVLGLLVAVLTAPIWGATVKSFCKRRVFSRVKVKSYET